MSEPLVLVEKLTSPAKVALVTFNRPKVMNALNDALAEELAGKLAALDADSDVHVIVVTGNEKAFAPGADIAAPSSLWSADRSGAPGRFGTDL